VRQRWPIVAFAFLSVFLMGIYACFPPFARIPPVDIIDDPDARCGTLASVQPPDLDFDPTTGVAWVVDPSPVRVVSFDVDTVPPATFGTGLSLPLGDQLRALRFLEPLPIAVPGISGSLALLTATNADLVRLVDLGTDASAVVPLNVSVPASLDDPTYPGLPPPGQSAEVREAVSTRACVDPDLPDSRGDDVMGTECPGFFTRGTSSAAVIGTGLQRNLFVSLANLGADPNSANPQYFPGTVLVYRVIVDEGGINVRPNVDMPVIYTTGFNPTQLTPYSVGGRNFLLVTVSGAIGTVQDDLGTSAVEGGFLPLTDSAIDVIDADTLQLVATIPLGEAGLVGNLAVHPGGRLAVVGSMIERALLAVDLAPLADADLPDETPMSGPVVLDGSTLFGDAVVRDASNPYEVPARVEGGADPLNCPGLVAGVAFNDSGSMLYATDYCDGTLDIFAYVPPPFGGRPGLNPDPQVIDLTAPSDTPNAVDTPPHGLGVVAVRPGDPSSYAGPDVFVIVGEPNGLLCAVAIESGE